MIGRIIYLAGATAAGALFATWMPVLTWIIAPILLIVTMAMLAIRYWWITLMIVGVFYWSYKSDTSLPAYAEPTTAISAYQPTGRSLPDIARPDMQPGVNVSRFSIQRMKDEITKKINHEIVATPHGDRHNNRMTIFDISFTNTSNATLTHIIQRCSVNNRSASGVQERQEVVIPPGGRHTDTVIVWNTNIDAVKDFKCTVAMQIILP